MPTKSKVLRNLVRNFLIERGNGIGQVAGRMTSMLAPYATVPLFERFGVIGVTGSLAALFVITGAVVAVFGIETRRRSLEAMELPTGTPWALRDEHSARMLDEERPVGAQVRERTRLVLIPKAHLG